MSSCSSCGNESDRKGQRYCKACHAAYMREHRPKHKDLSPIARMKANARSYANVYQRRGKIDIEPCEQCGSKAEKHHEDYSKPVDVRWLCRDCHIALHKDEQLKVSL